jgi:predicted nucleotidyltransferase
MIEKKGRAMTAAISAIRTVIGDLAPEYGIGRAYVFGSYARGEQSASSDVDLLIELDRPLGFRRGNMCLELEARLGLPVDVVFGRDQLYPPIRRAFDRDAVAVYVR